MKENALWARISGFFRPDAEKESARTLYAALVARARDPRLYAEYGAPDTMDGRFDMIALFVSVALVRLKGQGEEARRIGQRVFDLMFRDFDDALRALGVGDTSVPKKIKKMASAYYGRLKAYDDALAAGEGALAAAVARNVFGDENDPRGRLLADEARAFHDRLSASPLDAILSGRLADEAAA